jgi:hypothetical protein
MKPEKVFGWSLVISFIVMMVAVVLLLLSSYLPQESEFEVCYKQSLEAFGTETMAAYNCGCVSDR